MFFLLENEIEEGIQHEALAISKNSVLHGDTQAYSTLLELMEANNITECLCAGVMHSLDSAKKIILEQQSLEICDTLGITFEQFLTLIKYAKVYK